MLFVHSAAWVRRLDGAQALVVCWWRWNAGLVSICRMDVQGDSLATRCYLCLH